MRRRQGSLLAVLSVDRSEVLCDDPAWARFTVRSDEVPTIDPEFLAQERRSMSPDAYASEYEGVFGKAGASLFTLDQLAGLILPKDGAA